MTCVCPETGSGCLAVAPHGAANLVAVVALGGLQLVISLEVHPELRCGAQKVGQPQGGVSGHAPAAPDDLGQTIRGNPQFFGYLCGRHVELIELNRNVLTWMRR